MTQGVRVLLVFVLFAAACASGGARGTALYRRDIGNASEADALTLSHRIITRYHYEVFQQESQPIIRIETHWRARPPFADEQAMGITNAESRLIVTARIRGDSEMGSIYNVQMQIENRVRVAGGPDWNETTNTPMFRAYADEIVREFKSDMMNIGVRRFQTGM
jgi:hypothetical protein